MANDTIKFWNFRDNPTGGFSCDAASSKIGRTDRLEFAMSPNPGPLDPDAIAIALSTLCGRSYSTITMELKVSDLCARAVADFTRAEVSFAGESKLDRPHAFGGNYVLNFSGGFDSLAAYSLMPENSRRLVSLDWGGRFFREAEFFNRFNPCVLRTNIKELGYCNETWTFMGVGMVLFARHLGAGYGVFGGNFEASISQMVRYPTVGHVFETAPYSFMGLKDIRVTNGLTEVGSIMAVMKHSPSLFVDSLKSVAAPGTEKAYRKSVLSYIVNEKFGYGVPVPIQNQPAKPAYKFGDNAALDVLCLYEMKNVGRDIASKTIREIPAEAEDLVRGMEFAFCERLNTNFLASIPAAWQGWYIDQLMKAGIRPYDEEDWYELDAVCKFLSQWHPEFADRTKNSRIGQPRAEKLVTIPYAVTLAPKPGLYNWAPLSPTLERGRKYTLSVGRVEVECGSAPQVSVRLYDLANKKGVSDRKFDLANGRELSNLRWEFETPLEEGDYRVIAYAGVPGKCDGVGVAYRDISVS